MGKIIQFPFGGLGGTRMATAVELRMPEEASEDEDSLAELDDARQAWSDGYAMMLSLLMEDAKTLSLDADSTEYWAGARDALVKVAEVWDREIIKGGEETELSPWYTE